MRDNMGNTAPVQEGEELEVKIEAVGDKGDGIAKKDGFVLVVPGTKVNEVVKIKITKVLRKVGFAEVVERVKGKHAAEEESDDEESDESEDVQDDEDSEDSEDAEDSEDFGDEE